jgi:plasmid stabilization system protein ParE
MADAYTVIVAPEALVEIVQIGTWWSEHRPSAPRLFQAELDQALTLLAAQPELGTRARSKRVGNARVVELVRSRHRVFYQLVVAKRQVLVVHVRHGSRRPLRPRRR